MLLDDVVALNGRFSDNRVDGGPKLAVKQALPPLADVGDASIFGGCCRVSGQVFHVKRCELVEARFGRGIILYI